MNLSAILALLLSLFAPPDVPCPVEDRARCVVAPARMAPEAPTQPRLDLAPHTDRARRISNGF